MTFRTKVLLAQAPLGIALVLLAVLAVRTVTSLGATTSRLPNTPVALLVLKGGDGTVAGMALLALDGSGSGGNVLVVPAGTEVPGANGQAATRLGDAYAAGGLDAAQEAVEGLFGITTSLSEEVDEPALAALLAPYSPVHITLDTRALDTGANGQSVVLHPAGAVDLDANGAAQLLLAHGVNESEAARLNRTVALWAAVLKAGAPSTPTTAAPGSTEAGSSAGSSAAGSPAPGSSAPGSSVAPAAAEGSPTTVAGQLAAIVHGRSAVRVVPVHPVLDAVANPQGLDLLQLDDAATKLLLAQTMPGAISPANDNIRLQVVNATGDPNLLAEAVARLVAVGANVVIVSDAPSPSQATLIDYQDPRNEAEAQTYVPVVGPATVRQGDERIDGIDATIIVGKDFAAFAQQQAASPATSTPIPATSTPAPSTTGT